MVPRDSLARWSFMAAVLVSCIGCDQATKHLAQSRLRGQPSQSFCGDMFRLEYAENAGAFLGLGGQLPPPLRWGFLVVVNSLLAAGIAAVLVFNRRVSPAALVACVLLLSGALGNLIDRLRFDGLVIDFLNVGLGPLRTGIFNVADMAIMAGALLLVWPAVASRPGPSSGSVRQ
jgi:signal peptidase II